MRKITKKALADMIAGRGEVSKADALTVLNTIDDILAEEMKANEAGVYLDNIGTFKRVLKPATRKYNPFKGETVDVPARIAVRLKASKTLIERVQ